MLSLLILVVIATVFVGCIALLMLPALLAVASIKRQAEKHNRLTSETIVAQYDPPMNLSPAQVGYLYDIDSGLVEIEATIIDLIQRGIVKKQPQSPILIAVDPVACQGLLDYEKTAIIYHDSVDAANKAALVKRFERSLRESLLYRGLKIKNKFPELAKRVGLISLIIGSWPIFLFTALGVMYNEMPIRPLTVESLYVGLMISVSLMQILFPFYLLAGYVLVKIWIKIVGQFWLASKSVMDLWPLIEGYRDYLKTADLEKIEFEVKDSKFSNQRSYPYLVALQLIKTD